MRHSRADGAAELTLHEVAVGGDHVDDVVQVEVVVAEHALPAAGQVADLLAERLLQAL